MKESSLIYLIQDHKWLMLYRNKKNNDVNHGKWIGVGGKKEKNESIQECACREVLEETGFIVDKLNEEGILYFTYPHLEDEKIYIYTCTEFHGTFHDSIEGTLSWVDQDKLLDLELWEGDRIFLKKLCDKRNDFFTYHFTYDEHDTLLKAEAGEKEHD